MEPPVGFKTVSRDEFFQLLYADPRDIMPNHDHPDHTTWKAVNQRVVWGWSYPGWRNPGEPPAYAVREVTA